MHQNGELRLKNLFLSLALIISANAWADMDDICFVFIDSSANTDSYWGIADYIGKNCDRDNILQMTGDADGKRVFNMAPLHHHYELKGWPEPRVIVRFWIITFMLVLLGLALLRLR